MVVRIWRTLSWSCIWQAGLTINLTNVMLKQEIKRVRKGKTTSFKRSDSLIGILLSVPFCNALVFTQKCVLKPNVALMSIKCSKGLGNTYTCQKLKIFMNKFQAIASKRNLPAWIYRGTFKSVQWFYTWLEVFLPAMFRRGLHFIDYTKKFLSVSKFYYT